MKHLILREALSSRGGGIEISLDKLGKKYKGDKMTAYQNYLGGGLLGSVQNDCTIQDWRSDEKLVKTAEELSRYVWAVSGDESEFEQVQDRPASGY